MPYKRNISKAPPRGWPADLTYPADRYAIGAAIRRRGNTLTGLAKAAGIAESACRMALYRSGHRSGEVLIAEALGVSRADLFPADFWSVKEIEATAPIAQVVS